MKNRNSKLALRKGKNAVIYTRVASYSQIDDCSEIDQQILLCSDYCQKNKLKVKKVFSDKGESAFNMRRKGLVKLLEYLERNRFAVDYVVVRNIDRLSRNYADYFILKEAFKGLGVTVKPIDELDESNFSVKLRELLFNYARKLNV